MKPVFINDLHLEATPLGGQARTLISNPELRLVNLLLEAGEQVGVHSAPVEVVFIALEGRATVLIEDQTRVIETGQFMACPADSNRSIKNDGEDRLSLLVIRTPNR